MERRKGVGGAGRAGASAGREGGGRGEGRSATREEGVVGSASLVHETGPGHKRAKSMLSETDARRPLRYGDPSSARAHPGPQHRLQWSGPLNGHSFSRTGKVVRPARESGIHRRFSWRRGNDPEGESPQLQNRRDILPSRHGPACVRGMQRMIREPHSQAVLL